MKKFTFLVMVLVLGVISFASAEYVDFIGQPDGSGGRYIGVGSVNAPENWDGGAIPYGEDIGRIAYANNVWIGGSVLQNIAVRLEGGTFNTSSGLALRGGTAGSGITTLLELDTTDWETVTNLLIPDGKKLTFWSQYGEDMVLNVLNGSVQTSIFSAPSHKGTVNMGNGIFHAGSAEGTANYNMLAGGSGDIIFDEITSGGFSVVLNFETGNTGSFTFGSKDGGLTTGGTWEWYINNGKVSVDGIVNTDLAAYNIEADGLATTISLVPEPATMMLLGFGSLLVSRRKR